MCDSAPECLAATEAAIDSRRGLRAEVLPRV